MRLIDADDLISYIESTGLGTGENNSQKEIIEAIEDCPTFRGIDKILEKLIEMKDAFAYAENNSTNRTSYKIMCEVIENVRRIGGDGGNV